MIGTAAGAPVPPLEYFRKIREICDRHDVLFIADEVMCGMGRTGKPFAIEHWGVKPDLIAAGKGMASGYAPLSGLLVSLYANWWWAGETLPIEIVMSGVFSGFPWSLVAMM